MHKDPVRKAFLISVLATVILAAFKLIVGYLSNSLALRYDAFESLADLLIFASLYGATLLASKPPDSEHLYGHTKIEDLAALYTGVVIFIGGIYFDF
jgi:cation diffusion facilitator family transporter